MPKVSVIVPCYNVAPYLERCLDSLLGQTLRDIEIICVDDKSTDNSLEILNKYAEQDKRITVIAHEQNSGVSTARNNGMAAAKGEYLGFVDPDDYVDLDFYEKLYSKAVETGADITRGVAKITEQDGSSRLDCAQMENIRTFGKWRFLYYWWTAIYSRKMLKKHQIQFPTHIPTGQDVVFLTYCISHANKVAVCDNTNYNYMRHDFSLDENIMPPYKIESRINTARMILDVYNTAEISTTDYLVCYHDRWNTMKALTAKNTSLAIKRLVLENFVDLYKRCRNPRGLLELHSKRCSSDADYLDLLRSHDVDGLLKYMTALPQSKQTSSVHRSFVKQYLLFNTLPLIKVTRDTKNTIIRFCGIQLYRIKRSGSVRILYILYIPILQEKTKNVF